VALVPKANGKHRVSHDEASTRLIEATIKLAGETLMSDLTVGKIANEAGLGSGNVLVKRYFGFRKDLLLATTSKLADQIVAMLHEPRENLSDNPVINAITIGAPTHVLIRKRFILISELVEVIADDSVLRKDSLRILQAMALNYQKTGISERMAFTIAMKTYALSYAQYTVLPLVEITKDQLDDIQLLMLFEYGNANEVEKQVGWA
jgi:AcrR family transcriptional regulator